MIEMSRTINITYAIKIVRIKQKRRNKIYNDNHIDIHDNNNNISNKNQLDLRLSNVKSDDCIDFKKSNC